MKKKLKSSKPNTPKVEAHPRIFASLKYLGLRIGRGIEFSNGFFISRDLKEQQRIAARSPQHAIRDITDLLVGEAPFTEGKRVYFCSPETELVVEPHRVEFRNGLFSSADPDLLSILWKSPKLRTKEIVEVPLAILQLAAELTQARDTLKAATA